MKEIFKRLKCKTPVFFKKLRVWLVSVGLGLIGFGTTLTRIDSLPDFLMHLAGVLITIGGVTAGLGGFLTSLPMHIDEETKAEAKQEIKEEISEDVKIAIDKTLKTDINT